MLNRECLSSPSIRLGTGDLARYPFLNEAGLYIRESGFNWDELERTETSDILARAIDRVNAAVEGNVYRGIDKYEVEILSFLISLLIVKSVGIDNLTRKYSLAEARRAEEFLGSDMKKSTQEQRRSLLYKIFEDLFGLKMVFDNSTGMYAMSMESYLRRSSHFHEKEWKLVNRPVFDGKCR